MEMTPIKKIIIGIAAITVALSLITANNMASIMLIVASRNAGAATQQTVQTNQPVQQNQATNNSQGSQSSSGNTATGNDNTATTSTSTDNTATTAAPDNSAGETKPADNNGSGNTDSGKKLSEQELVDLYKKAVNAARTKSKSVVRVKDGAINYNGIVEAGGLSSVGKSLMGMFMVADEASIEVKNEPWEKEKLPDASALTMNGLQKISYEDKGDKYVVTLVAKNKTNPKAGEDGIGAISGVIEESQITGAISSFPLLKLENINIAYENVTTVATIDKATGNLVALNLNSPCILGLDASMGVSIKGAKVGIQVITEYAIAY